MTVLYVVPAYGRSYKNKLQVVSDWENNKDFKISGGPYIDKYDFKAYSCLYAYDQVVFKYGRLKVLLDKIVSLYTSDFVFTMEDATRIANKQTKEEGIYYTAVPGAHDMGWGWAVSNRYDPEVI